MASLSDPRSLDTVKPDTPSHADNGDFSGRDALADTDRNGAAKRTPASAIKPNPIDFRTVGHYNDGNIGPNAPLS